MHELSIAQGIVEIAEAKARELNSRAIQAIKVRLGEFTTIDREALEFAFEAARRDTLAETARLEIETVPMVVRCAACGSQGAPAQRLCLICSQCGFPLEILSGKEITVEYIELE